MNGIPLPRLLLLGLQHAFTMFGSVILVPLLTGLDISVALFMAGTTTLVFHFITKGRVPVFLGSSFAFIAPIVLVSKLYGIEYALGGLVATTVVYITLAFIVSVIGAKRLVALFPPVVTGPIIITIGLMLAPVAVSQATDNWFLAIVSFVVVGGVSMYAKGFWKLIPILCGLVVGYVAAVVTGNVDFSAMAETTKIVGIPDFTLAKFNFGAMVIVIPVAVATVVEHIGDMMTSSEVVGENFLENPGLSRTLLGDGMATAISAMFGGPAMTTYSENTGVLALTKVYNPVVMRVAACFAILLGFMPVVAAVIRTIPLGVIGGVSIILFGMIASVGLRMLVEGKVDFKKSRNLFIAAVVMVLGLGDAVLKVRGIELGGVGLAALVGILLNKLLPESADDGSGEVSES